MDVRLVTFAGLRFDLPTLLQRSMYLEVDAPPIDIDRYRSPHAAYDLHWHLSRKGVIQAHGLKFYAKRFNLPLLDRVNGGDIAQLFADGDWPAIEAHCLSDVGLTHALANRVKLLRVGAANFIVTDIETVGHPDAAQWFDPVKPDARLKDPEKIAASIAERTAERDAQLALHPDTNRIIAIGYHVIGHSDPYCLLMRDEYEEKHMLAQFWAMYREIEKR